MKLTAWIFWAFSLSSLCAQEVRRALPVESPWDERARLLAAIQLSPDTRLAAHQNTPLHHNHIASMNKMWERFNQGNFQKQLTWSKAEVAPRIPPPRVLYYLFSGPDFVNAVSMFPDCETYILCGLEPIGQMPAPESLAETDFHRSLENLRQALRTILEFGFFITKDMKVDLHQTQFNGVLPIIATFLALTGCQLLDVQFLTLQPNGTLSSGGKGAPAVQIRFSRGASLPPQTLIYLQANLANDGTSGLFTWLEGQPAGAAYLKAASYLMHETYFSKVRNFLLNHCVAILQDDSGIPFRYFDPHLWQITLFGTYQQPIEIFQNKFQADYRKAYETIGVHPLPFGTGYNWRLGESNLMLAVRRSAIPIAPAVPTPPAPEPSGARVLPSMYH